MSLRVGVLTQPTILNRIDEPGACCPSLPAPPASCSDSKRQLWGLRPIRWALRIYELNPDCGVNRPRDGCDVFTRLLGLRVPAGTPPEERPPLVEQRVAQISAELRGSRDDSVLNQNFLLLQQAIALNGVEIDLLAFSILQRRHPEFSELVDAELGRLHESAMTHRVAEILCCSPPQIESALDPRSSLTRSGLAHMDSFSTATRAWGWFEPMRSFARRVLHDHTSAEELLRETLPRVRRPTLTLADYPHLSEELRLLCDCLELALRHKRRGVNVLLYGRPGTGKSELAAAIAGALGCHLYEIGGAGEDEEASTSRERLRDAVSAQRVVSLIGGGLVLIDEAEDFFPAPLSLSRNAPTKVAINENLEQNPAPTIWICNRTRHIEEAFLRRFDMVLHVPALPVRLKSDLMRKHLPTDALPDSQIDKYASCETLSPASLARMTQVAVDASRGDLAKVRSNLSLLAKQYLRTLGADALTKDQDAMIFPHDPGLLNTVPALDCMMDTMVRSRLGGRLLFYGAPGTGKTALGKELAVKMDKPLLQYQASSLLSCYVGETEHNLRRMFEHAQRESGLLLLDEADGFLRAREGALARWEVTQVNELLTQMESYEGIFVCTTNRVDDLDPAALRRFDLKVEFRPLDQRQRFRMIRQCCQRLGIEVDCSARDLDAQIQQLDGLTPGDAAAALRRLRLLDEKLCLDALLAALMDECHYKPAARRPIGFLH